MTRIATTRDVFAPVLVLQILVGLTDDSWTLAAQTGAQRAHHEGEDSGWSARLCQ